MIDERKRPSTRRNEPGFQQAFTLLEVALVLGVILLLSGLLLPLVSVVTEHRKSAVCVGNLHQWGVAVNLYAADHNGCFPPGDPKTNGNNNNGIFALAALSPYVGVKVQTFTTGTPQGFPACPARDKQYTDWYSGNYAWNPYLLSLPVSSSTYYGFHTRPSTLDHPKILMTDSLHKHTLGYYDYVAGPNAPKTGWPNQISYRHGKFANFLWSDGHVESISTNAVGHSDWFY